MKAANDMPIFLSIYKSMSDIEKRKKLIIPYVIETGISEDTWFRKVRLSSWNQLEKKWLSTKLNITTEELFPI